VESLSSREHDRGGTSDTIVVPRRWACTRAAPGSEGMAVPHTYLLNPGSLSRRSDMAVGLSSRRE
jgi:hypothetical protein